MIPTMYVQNQYNAEAASFTMPPNLVWDDRTTAQIPSFAQELRGRAHRDLDSFQYRIKMGHGTITELHRYPAMYRKKIAQEGPYLDVWLGSIKLHKRVPRTLIYLFAPEIHRFLEPRQGRIVAQFPDGATTALSMKLAVLYMEQACCHTNFVTLPWKVLGDVSIYIGLADAFRMLGMMMQASMLDDAIGQRMLVSPLRLKQVKAIWDRENQWAPTKYACLMAANIATFSYSWKSPISDTIEARKLSAQQIIRGGGRLAERYELELYLDDIFNTLLKQLVWNSQPFQPWIETHPRLYIEIEKFYQYSHVPHVRPLEMRRLGVRRNFTNTATQENEPSVAI